MNNLIKKIARNLFINFFLEICFKKNLDYNYGDLQNNHQNDIQKKKKIPKIIQEPF
jgi:hypothetical protein